MRAWNRLDRYVSSELRSPFWLGLSGFCFIFVLNFLFRFAVETIEKNVPVKLVMGFLITELPRILMLSTPMACLMAVLVAMGRLSSQGELLALRATGIPLTRIYRPILIVSALLLAVMLAVAHFGKPLGAQYRGELAAEIQRARDLNKEIDAGVFFSRLPGAVFYAEKAVNSSEGRVFEGVLLYRESRKDHLADLIIARRGQASFDGQTGRIVLRLDDVEWHAYDPDDPSTYTIVHSPFETLTFPAAAF